MKRELQLGAIVIVLLIFGCRPPDVETFDGAITALAETPSARVPSVNGLTVSPPTPTGKELFIRFEMCTGSTSHCTEGTASATLDPFSSYFGKTISIQSTDGPLRPMDLRIGQQLIVNYARKPVPGPQALIVKGYLHPTKFLRVNMLTSLPKSGQYSGWENGLNDMLITHLSWRLPPDIGLVKAGEVTDENQVIGEIALRYSLIETDTVWQLRDKKILEFLDIKTQLTEANQTSNWAAIKASGGSTPRGNNAMDWDHESTLIKVPFFEITNVN
ncbi:MAG: hypothetical protein ABR530_09650 [Pyrinomonadaceae bacterium]